MRDFYIGQKLVCLTSQFFDLDDTGGFSNTPKEGEVVTFEGYLPMNQNWIAIKEYPTNDVGTKAYWNEVKFAPLDEDDAEMFVQAAKDIINEELIVESV